MTDDRETPPPREEPPPVGGSWGNLYAAVLLNLAALFYLFTRYFG